MRKKILSPVITLILLLSVLFGAASFAYADNETDNSALLAALRIAETMDENDYTADSFQALHNLYLTYAASADTLDSQEAIDEATTALLEAVNTLTPYLTLTTEADADSASITIQVDDTTTTDSICRLVYGTTVTVTAPEVDGYWFAGWLETVSKRFFSDEACYTFPLTVNTSLRAIYIKDGYAPLAFGTEGGCVVSLIEKKPEEWAAVDDLAALAPAVPYHYGYTNGRWDIPPEALRELTDGEFVFITPIYDEAESDLPSITAPAEDTIRLELHYRYDAAEKVGSFIMNAARPQGMYPESIGMLFYYGKASEFDPTQFYVNNNNKMMVSQFDFLGEDIYITNMRKMTSQRNWAVRGFATYYDDNGELKTIYSDQVNIVRTKDIHDYRTSAAVAPTCTEDGHTASEYCFICGDVVTPQETIPATGHDYTEAVTPPTCTESGAITYTCTRCEDTKTVGPEWDSATESYTHPELLPTGHDFVMSEVVTPATLSETGVAEMVCSLCGSKQQEPLYVATGSCGDTVTYTFDHRDGTLTISGNGAMTNYESKSDSPFYQMDNLQSLIVESGVTAIGDCAFSECHALNEITLGNTVTTIGNRAFYGCSSLTTANLNAGLTDIDYYAFYGCGLTSLSLPSSLRNISNYVFSHCNSLTDVTLPGTLGIVSSSAFSGCEALASVTIGAGIDTLESGVFTNCKALSSVTLESGVAYVPDNSFSGCTALTDVQLPNSLVVIGNQAFKDCTALTAITLPSRLYSIDSAAFRGCTSLQSITFPDSLVSIGDSAFADCGSLNTQLPSRLQTLGTEAFRNCSGLTNLIIPNTLTTISNNAFNGCSGITSISLPDTLTAIGNYSFCNCSALTALTLPAATESIGTNAFAGCGALSSISVDSANAVYDSRNQCNAILETATDKLIVGSCSTVIPDGVTAIADYAFSSNAALTAITIPATVTAIGNHVFDGCSSLTTVSIPDSVTTMGDYTFTGCTALQQATLPSTLTRIPKYAFSGCSALNDITLPDSITTVDQYAFEDCSSLTDINLPSTVTTLGSFAFSGCSQLQSIRLPGGITTIPARTFNNCSSLNNVTIPAGVRTIGTYAFAGCTGITVMELPNTVTTLSNYAFKDCTGLTDIYIHNIGCKIGQNAATIPTQTVIHGLLSSTAKTYADKFGRSFSTL